MSIINRVLCANLKCYQRSFTTAFSQKYPPPLQKSFSFNFVRESKVQAQRSLSLGRGLRVTMEAKKSKGNVRGLVERLEAGEEVVCAEGYLLALCRMGYIAHGVFVPEFLLEEPEVLKTVHHEFIHAGSDVTEAFQYYTHREKMRQIGREKDLERINRTALKIAREVADDTDTLMAGGICNTNIYIQGDQDAEKRIRSMFEEQVRWAKEEGADYIIAETIPYLGEAEIALDVIQSFDLPAVVTMAIADYPGPGFKTLDGIPIAKALRTLLDKGATIVGSNCYRGPGTMLPVLKEIVKEVPPEKVCVSPVLYRTTEEQPTFFDLKDEHYPKNNPVYPHGLDAFQVSVKEVQDFTQSCKEMGIKYYALCCGNTGNYTRAMTTALGRNPPASRYLNPENKGLPPLDVKETLKAKKLDS